MRTDESVRTHLGVNCACSADSRSRRLGMGTQWWHRHGRSLWIPVLPQWTPQCSQRRFRRSPHGRKEQVDDLFGPDLERVNLESKWGTPFSAKNKSLIINGRNLHITPIQFATSSHPDSQSRSQPVTQSASHAVIFLLLIRLTSDSDHFFLFPDYVTLASTTWDLRSKIEKVVFSRCLWPWTSPWSLVSHIKCCDCVTGWLCDWLTAWLANWVSLGVRRFFGSPASVVAIGPKVTSPVLIGYV